MLSLIRVYTFSMDLKHEEEARSFSEIIQAMVSLIAEQDTKAIYAPLFSDLEEHSKMTLDTIQRRQIDLSQSISQVRDQLIQSHDFKMKCKAKMEKVQHDICDVQFPRDAKDIFTIQQHRIRQTRREWGIVVNNAENTAMNNVIQQGILHALLQTPGYDIPTCISNTLQSVMQDYIQHIEKAEHIYNLMQSLNNLWQKIQPLNDTLEKQMQQQQVKERMEQDIISIEKSLITLKHRIITFLTCNIDRQVNCIGIQAQNLEKEMDLIEQHLNQFKTNVLHPGIGERLHTVLKNFNLVLR